MLDQKCGLDREEQLGQGIECCYLSVLLIVDSAYVLTTSKISIIRLNADVQAVVEVISKMEEEHVFKMSTACAQEKDRCQKVDKDLKNDKGPDGPFLSSRIGFGDTEKEGTERQTTKQRTEIAPDQRDEAILESEVSLIGLQIIHMTTEAIGE